MRRVIAPAMLAVFVFAGSSAQAGFGLFGNLCNRGCDAACEPTCGCEIVEPTCGCEIVEPACGCEVVDPCCSPRPKFRGLLKKLFHKHNSCCDPCAAPACEPTCGIAPVDCGCAVIEPACGCEVAPSCGCEPAPCHRPLFGGLFKKMFHKHSSCCDPCAAPTCGCEPTCGIAPACGCGM